MKIQLRTLVESSEALQHLLDEKLPIKTAYKLQRTLRAVLAEVSSFEAARNALVRQLAQAKDAPGPVQVPADKMNEFLKQIDETLSTEVDVDVVRVPLSELGEVQLSVRDVLLLSYLVEDA